MESPLQRLRRLALGARGGLAKKQRVYLVELGAARFKHIIFPDSAVAAYVAENVDRLSTTGLFPRLVARYGNELWLEFIEGSPLDTDGGISPHELAGLFAAIYKVESRLSPNSTGAAVERDIELLANMGVVDAHTARSLKRLNARAVPSHAWFGYDYNDARPQNFLRTAEGGLRIVDVESIRRDSLMGLGVARVCLRWPGIDRSALLTHLDRQGAPDFASYLSFLELAFLTMWTKRCVLQRKTHLIDRELLQRMAASA